jgi:secreted trypsin-like serine protease
LLGRLDIGDDSEQHWVKRTISAAFVHDDYDEDAKSHRSNGDIAILKMNETVDFSDHIRPACLPTNATVTGNITGTMVGHGRRNFEHFFEKRQTFMELNTISSSDCFSEGEGYVKIASKRSFCARGDASPCLSDSGSGFFVKNDQNERFEVTGIVSHGLDAMRCNKEDYTAFTDVTKYLGWIRESE